MNNIRETLKEAFKPRQRNAFSAILIVLILMAVSIAGVLVATGTFFDLADTTSIVDAIDITGQTIYSDQGFVSVQVKNNGNTAIDSVHATLLVANNDGTTDANCEPGTQPLLITNNPGASGATTITLSTDLAPGESVTMSGGLQDITTAASATAPRSVIIDAGEDLECDNTPANSALKNRGEYILQINGFSDNDPISKTISVRAR